MEKSSIDLDMYSLKKKENSFPITLAKLTQIILSFSHTTP